MKRTKKFVWLTCFNHCS